MSRKHIKGHGPIDTHKDLELDSADNADLDHNPVGTKKDPQHTNAKKSLNYRDFQAFMVQYEMLIPELVDDSFMLEDRISALKELLKQNSELLAAAANPLFITNEFASSARPIQEVRAILNNSDELLNDILLNLQPRSKFQYR